MNAYIERLRLEGSRLSLAHKEWLDGPLRMLVARARERYMTRAVTFGPDAAREALNWLALEAHVLSVEPLMAQRLGFHRALACACREAWGAELRFNDPLTIHDARAVVGVNRVAEFQAAALSVLDSVIVGQTDAWDRVHRKVGAVVSRARADGINREHREFWRMYGNARRKRAD